MNAFKAIDFRVDLTAAILSRRTVRYWFALLVLLFFFSYFCFMTFQAQSGLDWNIDNISSVHEPASAALMFALLGVVGWLGACRREFMVRPTSEPSSDGCGQS